MSEVSPALYRAGEGEPLVLLHPFAATWHTWRAVLPELVARFEVIAPTAPGHHGGPRFEGAFSFPNLASQIERQLDELGVQTAHLVGSSTGAELAIELAKRGRARSVVALSPSGGWTAESRVPHRIARLFSLMIPSIRATAAQMDRIVALPRARQLAMSAFVRRGHLIDPADAAHFIRSAPGCTLVDEVVVALRNDGMRLVDLDRIAVPVLLAWSERDRIVPAATCSRRLREEIPGAEYRVLAGVGHIPMWDDHNLVSDTVVGWVSEHARAAVAV